MRTVFVIGAGANAEIGMPLGDKLKTDIADILDFTPRDGGMFRGDRTVYGAINLFSRDVYEHVHTSALDRFADAAINDIPQITCSQFFRDFWHSLSFKDAQTDLEETRR